MYQEFIVDFEAILDPLSLVQIAQTVMERFTDPVEAIAFIDKRILRHKPQLAWLY